MYLIISVYVQPRDVSVSRRDWSWLPKCNEEVWVQHEGGATCKWAQLFKFFILSSIALLGETPLVTRGWDTDALPLVWLVFSLVNAFANASAAPAKTSVTDSFRDFLGTLPENAGMSGGFSMSNFAARFLYVSYCGFSNAIFRSNSCIKIPQSSFSRISIFCQ